LKPQTVYGGADGPEAVIDTAVDGVPLTGLCGWQCWYCEQLYATVHEPELCCTESEPVGPDQVLGP
jgi:hypothetical protein